jgi:transposase
MVRRGQKLASCLRGPQNQLHLRALVTRLRQLTELRTSQLNQQRLVTDRAVQTSFQKVLDVIQRSGAATYL